MICKGKSLAQPANQPKDQKISQTTIQPPSKRGKTLKLENYTEAEWA